MNHIVTLTGGRVVTVRSLSLGPIPLGWWARFEQVGRITETWWRPTYIKACGVAYRAARLADEELVA